MTLQNEVQKQSDGYEHDWPNDSPGKVKFVVFGEEMLEKSVKPNGKSGRVYLPPGWIGRSIKVIRVD